MTINHLENPKEFWKVVLGEVQMHLSPILYNAFVAKTHVGETTTTSIHIICDNDFVKKNLEKKCAVIMQEAVNKIAQKELKVVVEVAKGTAEAGEGKSELSNALGPLFEAQQKSTQELIKEKQEKSNLSPRFTFENYIMGKNNNLAYAIATAVAERPGEQYNPVFIYSGVGLGKTHLIQAIGNRILETKPGTKVIYSTGEAFTNELIESIRNPGKSKQTPYEFRNKFRKADVFLIDDVQFIIGKESTQEEFFHTFNDLYMAQKQIVITSDRPPKEFNDLAARITSRFSSGIIVDIQAPDVETRAAILRNKRDQFKDQVSNEVIDFIAERVSSNIRELEGAYMQVITEARANGKDVTVDSAAVALHQSQKDKVQKVVNMNQILKAVCAYYSVRMPDIKGNSRTKDLVIPRQVTMYLIRELTKTPWMSIGEFLGGRDHSTIMYGVERMTAEASQQGKLGQDIANVRQLIEAE
jgi:chromosomal replication initiator protein